MIVSIPAPQQLWRNRSGDTPWNCIAGSSDIDQLATVPGGYCCLPEHAESKMKCFFFKDHWVEWQSHGSLTSALLRMRTEWNITGLLLIFSVGLLFFSSLQKTIFLTAVTRSLVIPSRSHTWDAVQGTSSNFYCWENASSLDSTIVNWNKGDHFPLGDRLKAEAFDSLMRQFSQKFKPCML